MQSCCSILGTPQKFLPNLTLMSMWSDYNHSTEVLLWELDKDEYKSQNKGMQRQKIPSPTVFSVPRGDKLLKVQGPCCIVPHTVHKCFTQTYRNPKKQRLAISLAHLISAHMHLTLQKHGNTTSYHNNITSTINEALLAQFCLC